MERKSQSQSATDFVLEQAVIKASNEEEFVSLMLLLTSMYMSI